MHKVIEQENGKLTIIENHHWIELQYDVPDWENNGELHACFWYRGWKYFLDDFMRIDSTYGPFLQGYHGIHNDSFFSGLLIVLGEGDTMGYARIYRYYS